MRAATLLSLSGLVLAAPAYAQKLPSADSAAAFRAAGFSQVAGDWRACDDPGTVSYTPGQIEQVRDLNGDGLPEAIITEGSLYCYGGDEFGFSLVSKQREGSWKVMLQGPGIATVLSTKGRNGWPDIEVGGQGFCFPVQRWNGTKYDVVRFEYQGKACKPNN